MNTKRVLTIVFKEWREIFRDRIYFSLAFLLPIVLMLVFGYGLTQEVENVPFVIVDYDRSGLSRDYAHRYIDSRYFDFKGYRRSAGEVESLLTDNKVKLAIIIPENFQERLVSAQQIEIQTLLDGSFTYRLRTIDGYVAAINNAASNELQMEYLIRRLGIPLQRAQTILQPIKLEVRYLYNQELREIWSIAPSLVMFILMIIAPLLTALSVVREKETGTIYNIYASTITRLEFLAGKLIPNVTVSFINAIILLSIATLYFGAPFKGNLLFFLLASLIYVIAISSIGLLISLMVQTQIAALMISIVLAFILAMQFSGMLTPVSSMTGANYFMAHIFPPKYFNDIVSNTFLKGGGLIASWREFVALVGFAIGLLMLGYLNFHKRGRT